MTPPAVAYSQSRRERQEERELENFLYQFPGPYAMFCAYLDESGTHDQSGLMGVAGVFYDTKSRNQLNRRWKKELEQAGIRYFHTVEQAHLRKEFADKTRQEADQLYQRLLKILRQHTCGSVAICSIPLGEFDVFRSRQLPYSQYAICAYICMSMLLLTAKYLGHNEVTFSIEVGPNMGELKDLIQRQRKEEKNWLMVRSYQFNEKEDIPAIQTADILAYETTKRVYDLYKATGRPLRKSLGSIIADDPAHRLTVVNKQLLEKSLMVLGVI